MRETSGLAWSGRTSPSSASTSACSTRSEPSSYRSCWARAYRSRQPRDRPSTPREPDCHQPRPGDPPHLHRPQVANRPPARSRGAVRGRHESGFPNGCYAPLSGASGDRGPKANTPRTGTVTAYGTRTRRGRHGNAGRAVRAAPRRPWPRRPGRGQTRCQWWAAHSSCAAMSVPGRVWAATPLTTSTPWSTPRPTRGAALGRPRSRHPQRARRDPAVTTAFGLRLHRRCRSPSIPLLQREVGGGADRRVVHGAVDDPASHPVPRPARPLLELPAGHRNVEPGVRGRRRRRGRRQARRSGRGRPTGTGRGLRRSGGARYPRARCHPARDHRQTISARACPTCRPDPRLRPRSSPLPRAPRRSPHPGRVARRPG